jgi:hypothetical protein
MDVSVLQNPECAAPGGDCFTADCSTPGRVYSTADCAIWTDCATWTCLFYSCLSWPWKCLSYSNMCCPWTCLFDSRLCAVPKGVWPTAACAAPGCVYLQEPVLHLYNAHVLLCYTWRVSVYRVHAVRNICAYVLLLDVSVYDSISGKP